LAPSVGTTLFLQKKKSVRVNMRRTNLSQNNTHEEVESIGLEARIANLQKNLEDLLAQNAVLQAD
jgi:hypothetical protein